MYILGLNLSHDYSACLLKDGEIRVAIALERIVRIKRGVVPTDQLGRALHELIYYCLDTEGITLGDVDYFVANTTETECAEDEELLLKSIGLVPPEKIITMPHPNHHLAHGCAAFYTSGFDQAAGLVVDCYGSLLGNGRESETGFAFSTDAEPEVVFRTYKHGRRVAGMLRNGRLLVPRNLQGIGEIYRVVTLILGFRQRNTYYDEAGKTMGLASYGDRLSDEPVMIRITDDGLDYSNAYSFLASHNLIEEDGDASYLSVKPASVPFSKFHKDLAAQAQWELEEACLYLARRVKAHTGMDKLVLSGGVFLNSVANYRILTETDFDDVFIFPAATDDGNAVGAAYYCYQELVREQGARTESRRPKNFYMGSSYSERDIVKALEMYDLPYQELEDREAAADYAAELLADGKIIAWYQGAAEFGPRALGNRSILANPTLEDTKEIVNRNVKFREPFRPFAPSVITEAADEFFELDGHPAPYMLLVCPVRKPYRSVIPSVTHVDGTARLQTVDASENPLYHRLITEFGKISGVPVVLNTSFNLRGMPIVETPKDAFQCFIATQIDYLILGRFAVPAPDFLSFVPVRNDLHIAYEGPWMGEDGSFEPASVRVTVENGKGVIPNSDTTFSLSSRQWALLESIDGRKRVRDIATELALDEEEAVAAFLHMYRDGILHWKHMASSANGQNGFVREPMIASMPYHEPA